MESDISQSPSNGPVKEVLAISSLISTEPPQKPIEEKKEVIDFFNRDFEKQKEDAFNPMGDDDDEDELATHQSRNEQDYAKQFLDYDQ